jgi:hypothetical protein
MALETAIEAVEVKAVRRQKANLATLASSSDRSAMPAAPVSQNGKVRLSLATLWGGFLRRADDGAPTSDNYTDCKGGTWLTEVLGRASRAG